MAFHVLGQRVVSRSAVNRRRWVRIPPAPALQAGAAYHKAHEGHEGHEGQEKSRIAPHVLGQRVVSRIAVNPTAPVLYPPPSIGASGRCGFFRPVPPTTKPTKDTKDTKGRTKAG